MIREARGTPARVFARFGACFVAIQILRRLMFMDIRLPSRLSHPCGVVFHHRTWCGKARRAGQHVIIRCRVQGQPAAELVELGARWH